MLNQVQDQSNVEQGNAVVGDASVADAVVGAPAIAIVDADLVLIVANSAFCALLERSPAQAIGQPIMALTGNWFGDAIGRLPLLALGDDLPVVQFLLGSDQGRSVTLSCSTLFSLAEGASYLLLATVLEGASLLAQPIAQVSVSGHHLLDEHQKFTLSQEAVNGLRNLLYMSISNRSLEQMLDYIYAQAHQLLAATGMAIFWKLDPCVVDQTLNRSVLLYAKGSADALSPALLGEEPLLTLLDGHQSGAVFLPVSTTSETQEHFARIATPLVIDEQLQGVLIFDLAMPFVSPEIYRLMAWLGDQVVVAHCADDLQQKAQRVAVHQERERLAREMHDAAMQSIYSLTLFAEAGRRFATLGKIDRVQDYLQQLSDTAKQALKELRLLLYELQPSVLEQVGLIEALRQRLESVERRTGMRVRLEADEELSFPAHIEEGLYRICQETLNNTLKHASATEVTVSLSLSGGELHLEICDNGIGFDSEDPEIIQSEGMSTMRERVRWMNARLFITSAPQQGACIHVMMSIPNSVD
jgi:signal transduction histidine kinase